VARALSGGAKAARPAVVDGLTALVWAPTGDVRGIIEFALTDDDRIVGIDVTGDPAGVASRDVVFVTFPDPDPS
jgi:RNA polymerase sigma-70 factor (ECF subfamily)